MGRDWYWRSGAKPSSTSNISKRDSAQTTLSGCITAVFHLFGSHHFHCPLNHQTSSSTRTNSSFKLHSFLSQDTTTIKGAEEEASTSTSASLTSTSKEEEILNIPMGIQIRTSGDIRSNNDTCSEISGTEGTKTPTLVARLMGLDLLPESYSPSKSSYHIQPSKPPQSKISGQGSSLDGDIRGCTRSLPETPRTSSARRSDVDHHHRRLSLQINKENMSASEELVMSRLSSLKRKDLKHEYEIVKQVKESVTRKVGMNITNAVPNREELVGHFRYKKFSRALTKVADDSSIVKHSTHSSSKFLEPKSNSVISSSTNYNNPEHPKSSFSSSPGIQKQTSQKSLAVEEEQDEQRKQQPRAASKCKKGSNKKLVSRLKKPQQALEIIRNKKEEPFVHPSTANRVNIPDKKCRKTTLSNGLLYSRVSSLLPVKKDPSPLATKIPQLQVLDAQRPKHTSQTLSSSPQTYIKQEPAQAHVSLDNENGDRCNYATTTTTTISTAGDEAENEYVARILRRTGLDKDTQVSFSSWFSPSHPLDPSIFHYLEHFSTSSSNDSDKNNETKCSQLSHRCNRKLLFHLVDELLAEILKPCFNMKPWVITVGHGFSYMDGSQLIDTLCSKIRSFPTSDCRVLEDIDALVGRDLPDIKLQSVMAYEEEGEGIVAEIEKDILQALVYEMTVEFGVRV